MHPAVSPSAQPQYTLKAGVVVSRPPLITPDSHPFETAYHLYQRRLNETGDDSGDPQRVLEQLVDEEGRSSEFTPEGGDSKTSGLKRETEADKKNDQQSLERSLSRTLYLLVNTGEKVLKNEDWVFPTGVLEHTEGLREAAKRVLDETCGANSDKTDKTEKTFFMKARIFAGQADVRQEMKAYQDFKWLSKEEIQEKVAPSYWSRIKDMLVAQ